MAAQPRYLSATCHVLLNALHRSDPLPVTHHPASRPPVSEEEQKEEVQRSAFSALQRTSLTHASPPPAAGARLSPLPSRAAEEAAAAAVAVPFTPITLVCRNIRCAAAVGGPARQGPVSVVLCLVPCMQLQLLFLSAAPCGPVHASCP